MRAAQTPAAARVVAFIDIGTNSLRLLLVRLEANHTYNVLTEMKHTVRLGEGEFATQQLQPAAMDRTVQVAQQFANLARAHGADDIIAVATAAVREAENQQAFVRRLAHDADLDVRVVSGLEEARLIYLGVCSGVHLGDKQGFFIDIGGGSTEVIVGSQHQHNYLDSLKLGAVRLGMRFLPDVQGPVSPRLYDNIRQYVRHHAVHTMRDLRAYHLDLAFGSSGTIENLADIAMRMVYKRRLQADDVLVYKHLPQVVEMLGALPLAERRKVPGLNPERADIILAGAAIVDVFMQELALPELRVSNRGLREGLLMDYLLRHSYVSVGEPWSVRAHSVLQLGRTCHFDETHARTTVRLALDLFDSASTAGLHRLGSWERELLEYAALLHHIGAFLTYNNYQAHTYYLIRNANLLGFDQTEIAMIATTALYHRKAAPRKKHPEFAALEKRAQQSVLILSTLLRLAESLDRGHTGAIQRAWLRQEDRKHAVLEITSAPEGQVELWGIQNHVEVFEKVFQKKLTIKMLMQ